MSKIISLIVFGGIMLVEVIGSILAYVLGMLYLLLMEIIGTKTFMAKFRKLNRYFISEIKNCFKGYKDLIERV
jgi:hypothetical protein